MSEKDEWLKWVGNRIWFCAFLKCFYTNLLLLKICFNPPIYVMWLTSWNFPFFCWEGVCLLHGSYNGVYLMPPIILLRNCYPSVFQDYIIGYIQFEWFGYKILQLWMIIDRITRQKIPIWLITSMWWVEEILFALKRKQFWLSWWRSTKVDGGH